MNLFRGHSKPSRTLRPEALLGLPVERMGAPLRRDDVEQSSADISQARELIGFEPQIGFEEGLQLTIDNQADKED